MSALFLCVQFRNLLPSEELLLSARALWTQLQSSNSYLAQGDATLSITQSAGDVARFEVELTVPGAVLSASAHDADALAGIERVFRQLADAHAAEQSTSGARELPTIPALGKSATLRRGRSIPDTGGGVA